MSCAASCAVATSAPSTPYYGGGYRRNYSNKKTTKKYSYKKKSSNKKSYKRKAYKKKASTTMPMNTGNVLPNDISNMNSRKRSRQSDVSEIGGEGAYNWRPAARWAANNLAPMAFNYGGKALGFDDELSRRASKWATGKLVNLIGSGAYNINPLAEVNQLFKHDPEMVIKTVNNETGDIIVSQSEFLFDVVPPAYFDEIDGAASSKFAIQGGQASFTTDGDQYWNRKPLVLNPGCSRTFPWLSKLASNFQEYDFIQLVFEYKPTISDGNTGISGTVVMFTQYNPNQVTEPTSTSVCGYGTITNKRDAEGIDYTNTVKPIMGALHGIECDNSKNAGSGEKLIREEDNSLGNVKSNYMDYDLGLFSLGLSNITPTAFTTVPNVGVAGTGTTSNGTAGSFTKSVIYSSNTITKPTVVGTFWNDQKLSTTLATNGVGSPTGFVAGSKGVVNLAAITLGELWVHYTVKLSKKKVSQTS